MLGWRFQRSRLLLLLLLLTLTQASVINLLPRSLANFSLAVIPLLLPVNLLWLAFVSERNFISITTITRLLCFAVQGGLVWFAYHFYAEQSLTIIGYNPWDSAELDPFTSLVPLTPLATIAFAVTFLAIFITLLWRPTMERGAQLWMVIGVYFAQISLGNEALHYTATAALILIVALLETSHSMAFRDELTGLGSRRALNEYLQRLSGTYTLAMVDIDHFKKVNDTYGHDIGDQVLKMVASCLAKVKGGGKAFRYGGEEFTIVFAGKKQELSVPHLETLRLSIAQSSFALRGKGRPKKKPKTASQRRSKPQTLSVTVSIGVAGHHDRKQSAGQVIKQADTALYKAKHGGRNQIC